MSGQSILFTIVIAAAALIVTAGCSSPTEENPEENGGLQPKLSSIQANVFTPRCALSSCHSTTDRQAGLDLSQGRSYSNLVNVNSSQIPQLQRVKPGDPDQSYLIMKLEGDPQIQQARMPFNSNPLPQSTINVIRQWISDGAQNN